MDLAQQMRGLRIIETHFDNQKKDKQVAASLQAARKREEARQMAAIKAHEEKVRIAEELGWVFV